MKKGLLLSIVASTVLFAGGDIAPVEPVAEAPAAACSDFYGSATVGVIAGFHQLGDDTSATALTYGAAAVLGVTKDIGAGLTFNAEVQGAAFQQYTKVGDADGVRSPVMEVGGLTQFNLGYTWCNTAIKVGRFSVPKNLSPLVFTGTDYFGLKKATFEGVLIANTDLPDTTVWAAYVHNAVIHATTETFLVPGNSKRARLGVIAAGLMNKSFADTTITLAGYYDLNGTGNQPWTWMAAGSIDHTWCDTDLSIGAAYTKWDDADRNGSYVVGAYVKQKFDMFDATLAATFSNDGMGYSKYTDITNPVIVGTNIWGVGLKLSTTFEGFKTDLGVSYSANKDNKNKKAVASVGISKTYNDITFSADYRYTKISGGIKPFHRVRAKAVYKF